MEAVPKLPLISFELKVSPDNTQFGPKLKQCIAEAYREDPDSYNNEIHQLEGLRSAAVRPTTDDAGLSAMIRYFCQLRAMQSRFPMAKGQPAACTFVWKDLYANMTCSLADVRFEMACILYNIGALHTQLGSSEPRTTPESLKSACTHYQHAAWAFQYIREQYSQPPGVDVCSEIVRMLQEICFAQAQECILDKSIQDSRKASVIGSVATQVLFYYRNALSMLGLSTGTDNIHEIIGTRLYNQWHRYLSFKVSYIGCIVCLYQGMNAEEQQKMGERVAFYQQAVEKLAEARKLAKYIEPIQITQEALTFTNDVVEGKRKAAKNENEFIYHEEVPDKDLLMELKPVSLVKALPINLNDPEVSGPDVFARLVPMGAHEASSMYSEEKAKLVRHIVSQAETKNVELADFMSSLQLDQLEILDSDQKIPQEIVDRCAAMNAKSEIIQTLVDSMNNLAEIISDVEHSLNEIKMQIQEEMAKEKEFVKVMGPRPPSIVQTELSREFHKYQEAHARTNESNQVLHKAMTLHIANLRLLAQPLDVLQAKIPSVDNIEGLDRTAMQEMRRVVNKAQEMQNQRSMLIQQLREALNADDITVQLLARTNEPPLEIFKQELDKHTPRVKIIEQNLAAQENIINKLTSLYASYGDSRRLLSDVLRKREALINALITSYDTYEELLGKSQKGLEFYKKLSNNVNQLLSRLRSTCQVQEEERAQLLSKQNTRVPKSSSPAVSMSSDAISTPAISGTSTPKLKDFLPYMKNRSLARSVTPQAPIDPIPPETYYPESIYPTSVRPAPVGSEATDLPQMKIPDGVVVSQSMQNPILNDPYKYGTSYGQSEIDPYSVPTSYPYSTSNKTIYDMDAGSNYSYSTSYTPPQYTNQISNMKTYSNPHYSATQDNATVVTDSNAMPYGTNQVNMNIPNQYNVYNDPYGHINQMGQMGPIPEATLPYSASNQSDISMNFAQMHVSAPKSEQNRVNFGSDYSQTYYSVQYSQVSTPNVGANYSNAGHSNTSMVSSQLPSDYSTSTYPYSNDSNSTQYLQPNVSASVNQSIPAAYNASDTQYSYGTNSFDASQAYATYTNSDSTPAYSNTSVNNTVSAPDSQMYSYPNDPNVITSSTLSHLDSLDKPIKSHVTGEALTNVNYSSYQNYDVNAMTYTNTSEQTYQVSTNPAEQNYQTPAGSMDQNYQPANSNAQNYQMPANPTEQNYQIPNQQLANYQYPDQNPTVNYAQSYQNHPGYTYNTSSGSYDYSYGSQMSYSNYDSSGQANVDPNLMVQNTNQAHGVYSSAGSYETVQSPSETGPTMPHTSVGQPSESQTFYNNSYGYQTDTTPSNDVVNNSQSESTNYVVNTNQSTYMQSGEMPETNVTYTNNQVSVSTSKEEVSVPSNNQSCVNNETKPVPPEEPQKVESKPKETIPELKPEPSAFDLLSDIDFTVEQKPLMPEIKVPQMSKSVLNKTVAVPKPKPVTQPVQKEEVIERPAKRDLFSDPLLLNTFTQEVKKLQKIVDSLTETTPSGLTLLDSKWKSFQDVQSKENMTRSKSIAARHSQGNIVADIVPYDDSRLTLKSDQNAYINASYYKQLASWCIPLVLSGTPAEKEYDIFWRAVLENKIGCVVCLLSELEMQGKTYWPTAIGQSMELSNLKVVLDEVTCNVHWTERRLTVSSGKVALNVKHYQINVFPSKIVCSPLVLLSDKLLWETYDNRLSNQLKGAWIQCATGGGRSALLALLLMIMCQVKAGQVQLCDMLDSACVNLYKGRTNVLEDTKFLADAYRSTLFYVLGVTCSGTTLFNGEAVSVPTGVSAVLPPAPSPAPSATGQRSKFSRESFEEMRQAPGLTSGDMKDPLNFLDPLWSLKKK